MDGLFERGLIVLGGPLEDGSGAVLVMEAASEAAIRELVADDPWHRRDILRVGQIREWRLFLDARAKPE